MDLSLPVNTVLRACDADRDDFKLTKDLRYAVAQVCSTAVSFIAFLSEKLSRSDKCGRKVLTASDVVRATSKLEIPGLNAELDEFLRSENKARNVEKFSTKNPIDVLLIKTVQEAAIAKFEDLEFPSNLAFNLDINDDQ